MTTKIRTGLLLGLGIVMSGAMWVSAATSTDSTSTPRRGQEIKMKLQEMRGELKSKMMMEKDNLKKRVMQFKDERKKQAAESLYDRLHKVNETWTDHFGEVLDKYAAILGRVNDRKATSSNSDVIARVDAAVRNASSAIVTARTAVETQAKKTYPVTVTSETNAKAAFQTAHAALKKDLFALRDGVMRNARQAVHQAIQSLRPATSTNATSSAQ
ncbi:MAG: hypothetical protein FJY98_02390 [Candidatus Liptonbacteria bacterium]|nr:hypothetical protein [Candidatus Liptonbacteria bacterium]